MLPMAMNLKSTDRATVLTWLQLMRLPTVFTALSNILCGYLITHSFRVGDLPQQTDLWLLLATSIGLYLGGMVLNDVFDAKLDAVERPERPIPSGRISRNAAALFGGLLMTAGVVAASRVGLNSLLVAAMIVPCVLAYNGYLKSTVAAPLGMSACRFLNLMLGASAVDGSLWHSKPLTVAAGLGIYIVGVTLFARNEAGRSSRFGLLSGVVIVLCGLGLDAWLISQDGFSEPAISGSRMVLLLLGLNLVLRASLAIHDPKPHRVQRTVGLMLLYIILIDAIVVFGLTSDAKLAALVVILVVPAMLLRRVVPMS